MIVERSTEAKQAYHGGYCAGLSLAIDKAKGERSYVVANSLATILTATKELWKGMQGK